LEQDFNQKLDNVIFPSRLQSLTFEKYFNQRLDNVTLPAGFQMRNLKDEVEKGTFLGGLGVLI